MMMLQHISPHFAAAAASSSAPATTPTSKSTDNSSSSSSGEESPGRVASSHERSPSPTEERPHSALSMHRQDSSEETTRCRSRSLTPMAHSDCSDAEEEVPRRCPIEEPRRRLQTAAMKKEMTRCPQILRQEEECEDVEGEDDEVDEDDDKSRPNSRCESPPLAEILTNRVSISQRLSDKFNGSIIRRALKQSVSSVEMAEREPVVVLNHQRLLLLRDHHHHRLKTESPTAVEEEDTDSNVPLDLSLNAEEKLQREQTEMFLRQHKAKDDGTESDDSGGPGEDRGRAYKKSLMKRYCEYPERVSVEEEIRDRY